ncbi:MAG: GntR family transcriptional regulator [Candidatus Gastranaerophilaceae bacterium]|nr:GntR family transcriptional regulator [Candidatus Gastranaerophilaceae bacterium]
MTDYIMPHKANLVRIDLGKLGLKNPDLKNTKEAKAFIIAKWMMNWIDSLLKAKDIKYGNLLPSKSDLAYHLGVSVGTIQNALRYLEDMNYVESKQRIGTMIKDRNSSGTAQFRKLTSKREIAIIEIKKFIITNKIKIGSKLPSSRALAALIGCSSNTTRLALENLGMNGILKKTGKHLGENGWEVVTNKFDYKTSAAIEQKTLVSKIEKDLKDYIDNNLQIGDKLPSHNELSDMFKVSIKTIHDGLKSLINEEILLARRGRYGTTVIRLPKDSTNYKKLEKSIFAPAKDTAFYYYEKTQNAIKAMIAQNYEIGSKLPSIMQLSKEMDLSPNTIRKAFQNLAKEGYLEFSRGRYGGTFVTDIPETANETFKWLAVNPQYAEIYSASN